MIKIIFSPRCLEFRYPGHPESPSRVNLAYKYLKGLELKGEFIEPNPCCEEDILLAHSKALLDAVKQGSFFEPDTPAIEGIFDYARLSSGAALLAASLCLSGDKVFSLMRPPGHHATSNQLGGFCYFNNIAIAIKKILGSLKKAAILDLDAHHGNGTEEIFSGQDNVLYVSLHQSPLYPGSGLHSKKNSLNYPLPAETGEVKYLSTLDKALEGIKRFKPDILGVSMGFDTYKGDPLANLCLEIESYKKIAESLSSLDIPTFSLLEGGYSPKLRHCLHQFLRGWER